MGLGSRHGKSPESPDFRFRFRMTGRGLVTAFFATFHQRHGAVIGRLIPAGGCAFKGMRTRGARIGTGMIPVFLFPIARPACLASLARLPLRPKERKPVIVPVLAPAVVPAFRQAALNGRRRCF
jgi:hypothetical protein